MVAELYEAEKISDVSVFVKENTLLMEKELAEFVFKIRKENKLTQTELATLADVHYRSVQNIEDAKKVRKGTRDKVLKALGYEIKTQVVFKKIE